MSDVIYNRVSAIDPQRTVYWWRAPWTGDKKWHRLSIETDHSVGSACGLEIEHRPKSTEWVADPGGYICRKCWATRRTARTDAAERSDVQ